MRCDATCDLTIDEKPVRVLCARDEPHEDQLHRGDAYPPGSNVIAFTVQWNDVMYRAERRAS